MGASSRSEEARCEFGIKAKTHYTPCLQTDVIVKLRGAETQEITTSAKCPPETHTHTHITPATSDWYSMCAISVIMTSYDGDLSRMLNRLLTEERTQLSRRFANLLLQNGFTIGVIALQGPGAVVHAFPVRAPCERERRVKSVP